MVIGEPHVLQEIVNDFQLTFHCDIQFWIEYVYLVYQEIRLIEEHRLTIDKASDIL